jgi:RNA polymerase sigma-70 factor (ECF subfamily)
MDARHSERLRELIEGYHAFVWRLLRRMGLADADAEDATQQVFIVASRKLDTIEPGRERAFLVSAAWKELAHARRGHARRREVLTSAAIDGELDRSPAADRVLDEHRARALLDEVLLELSPELRAVFVLFELEELGTKEIAAMLEIPVGTIASRLRRARAEFNERLLRKQRLLGWGE